MSLFDLIEGTYKKIRGRGIPGPTEALWAEFRSLDDAEPILDLGCGSGRHSVLLAARGLKNLHLADPDPSALHLVARDSRLHRTAAGAEALPYRECAFSGVFLIDVLHHVPAQETALEEISRVLTPGGRVLIMEYHRKNPVVRLFYLLSLRRRKRCSFYLPAELLEAARNCGLWGKLLGSDGFRFAVRFRKTPGGDPSPAPVATETQAPAPRHSRIRREPSP